MKNFLSIRYVLCRKKGSVLLPLFVTVTVFVSLICCESAEGQNATKKRSKPLSLVQLIAGSESMTRPGERMKWIQQLPSMSAVKRSKLRVICETERSKLADINRNVGFKPAPVPKLHGVTVQNQTASPITIVVPGYWFDENGEKHREKASWIVPPKTSYYLVSGKKRIHASQFLYQVKQSKQTYPSRDRYWPAYYDPAHGTIVTITSKDLVERRVAAKPVIGNGRSNADQLFDQFIQLAEDVNDIADSYDKNVKPIVSAIKKVRAKNSHRVYLKSIEVAYGKSNGKYWDSGKGAPDLIVRLKVKTFGGDSLRTSIVKNSYFGTYEEMSVRAKLGQTIEITVHDDDAFNNDLIGSYRFEITKELLGRGQTDLSFDQVESLVLRFEK